MSDFLTLATDWLAKAEAERDLRKGAELVLRITRNRIMYNNMMTRPERYAKHMEYQIQKWVKTKTAAISHDQVVLMESEASLIMEALEHKIAESDGKSDENSEDSGEDKDAARPLTLAGKRPDHDSLPPEVQALYLENFGIIARMRECHLQVRYATGPNQACIDADKWAFLKELIALDKKLHANWEQYDKFVLTAPAPNMEAARTAEPMDSPELKEVAKKALQQIKMAIGRYRKQPSEPLKTRILEWYEQIPNPTEDLKRQLAELGIKDEA